MNQKQKSRFIKKLMKIQDGDPSKFIYSNVESDGSGIGYYNYTFQQLVEYAGFNRAMEIANMYRKAQQKRYLNSKLVNDYLNLFANCFQATIDAGDCIYVVCVDPDGKMYDPPGDELLYREWEIMTKLSHPEWHPSWMMGFADEIDCEFKKIDKRHEHHS